MPTATTTRQRKISIMAFHILFNAQVKKDNRYYVFVEGRTTFSKQDHKLNWCNKRCDPQMLSGAICDGENDGPVAQM